jgi:pimeloyl-ACP methyl ester carboxylesterase
VEHIASAVALWHGEEDWLVPASATRYLASVIPGARVELLPGAGHFMIFDRWPDVCAWLAGEGA